MGCRAALAAAPHTEVIRIGVASALGLSLLSTPALAQDLAQGRALCVEACSSCHGASLEGQPNWQSVNPDGTYPAPPHSAEGHTWHHADAMLFDYVKRGGQAVLADMGVEFRSGMPAFDDTLTDAEIEAVLAYIRSTWPEPIQEAQAAME